VVWERTHQGTLQRWIGSGEFDEDDFEKLVPACNQALSPERWDKQNPPACPKEVMGILFPEILQKKLDLKKMMEEGI